MENSSNTIILLLVAGIFLLFVIMNCTLSCKEGFRSGFQDQVNGPYEGDFAYLESHLNPNSWRDGAAKKHVPLEQNTPQFPYVGLSGYQGYIEGSDY